MMKNIIYTPDEANEALGNGAAILVDVRDAEDYAEGHISGAVNIPEMFTTLSMTTPEGLKEMQNIFVPLFRNAGTRNYYGSWNEWSRHPELPIHEGVLAA